MKIDTILTIALIAAIVIGIISNVIWSLSKNKKIAKFFEKIADEIGETLSHAGG